jgi:hypothetical protein
VLLINSSTGDIIVLLIYSSTGGTRRVTDKLLHWWHPSCY